jgi:hypothetical protein
MEPEHTNEDIVVTGAKRYPDRRRATPSALVLATDGNQSSL